MKILVSQNVKLAYQSWRLNRSRSFLTVLGVVVAVTLVVTMVSLGEGVKQQISQQINRFGQDTITIYPGQLGSKNISFLQALSFLNTASNGNLTVNDLKVVQTLPHIKAVIPFTLIHASAKSSDGSIPNTIIVGTTSEAPEALNQTLQYGEFFQSEEESQDVTVLGQTAATQLFPGEVPLGRTVEIGGQSLIVRGELNGFGTTPLSLSLDYDNVIFVPYNVAQTLQNGNALPAEILVKPSSPSMTKAVATNINTQLLQANGDVQDFTVLTQDQGLNVISSVVSVLTKLITVVAIVSLVVGGVSVMNVMLGSVTERTQEIGLRKAIGATNRQILSQFLTDAIVLSLSGGIIGVVLSLIINVVLRILTALQPTISWTTIGLALAVAVISGIIFGIIPAIQAARKDPVEALRYK